MKKLLSVVLCLCICVGLSACESNNRVRISDYDEGYNDGYVEGLNAAIDDIADAVQDQYWALEGKTTKERGLHPEEAIMVLNDYLDGEYVSKEELRTAIRSISYFYSHAWDVIIDIEYMDIDFD